MRRQGMTMSRPSIISVYRKVPAPVSRDVSHTQVYAFDSKADLLAERGGFEPPVDFKGLRRFSKPLLSTTQPPLRLLDGSSRS